MKRFIIPTALAAVFALTTTDAQAQETMDVTASIDASIVVAVTQNMAFGTLAPAAANTHTAPGTFTLTTNTSVDVGISASVNGDLVKAAANGDPESTLNVTYTWNRDGGTESALFGKGEGAATSSDPAVAAGEYTYNVTATIKDAVTVTTLRGAYEAELTITATDNTGA